MLSFASDYIAGAHPKVLEKLVETNMEILDTYGNDIYTKSAVEKIKKEIGKEDLQVYLLTGGTQTNQIVIETMLDSYQGVITPDTGHINVHEAGAIEYSGHKVIGLKSNDGKLDIEALKQYMSFFYKDESHEHMVYPGMVYISYPTELGTLYKKNELEEIYKICKEYDMSLFVDGARLGYGLQAKEADISMYDLANLCDVFYIGGTKVGALCGEAVVFTHNNMPKRFNTKVKQRGAMIAKSRLLGTQFDALFTDSLYMEISKHAIEMAEELKSILLEKGFEFYLDSPTNQQFVIVDNEKMQDLKKKVDFAFIEVLSEEKSVIRFATSWSTKQEELDELRKIL
jgi:threonine aldolase